MKRIEVLDVWRSLAILTMVIYHLLYDLYLFDLISEKYIESFLPEALQWFSAISFMFISGAVARYSSNALLRGAKVFCCGLLVSLIMSFVDMPVQFGILHNLGIMMMAYSLVVKKLPTPKGIWFPLACLALFAASYYVSVNVTVETKYLIPFGLMYPKFFSADYYPLLPWGMIFAIGVWVGAKMPQWSEKANWINKPMPKSLCFPGRHSLVIYLVHQPIIYGLCYLLL